MIKPLRQSNYGFGDMAIFEVYASNNPELTRFVKDKGSIIALILPAFWLAWNRLWFALIIYLCVAFFFFAIGNTQWAMIVSVFSFIPGLYLFLEGPCLLAAKFERSGLKLAGVIEAGDMDSAELKWFAKTNIDERPAIAEAEKGRVSKPFHPVLRPVTDKAEFGLFAED
jgi:hypothetical protein